MSHRGRRNGPNRRHNNVHPMQPQEQQLQAQKFQLNMRVVMQSPDAVCSECQHGTFDRATRVKKVSRLMAGTPKDVNAFLDVLVCRNCNTILGDDPQVATPQAADDMPADETPTPPEPDQGAA
jgi:hypothetical protein